MSVGPSPRAGALVRLPGRRVAAEHVAAVDHHAGHAVARRARRDRAAGHLAVERDADGVAVVLAHEDDRQVVDAGEVHRLVDLALVGGALAELGHGHDVVAAHPGAHGDARPRGAPGCPTGELSDTMLYGAPP